MSDAFDHSSCTCCDSARKVLRVFESLKVTLSGLAKGEHGDDVMNQIMEKACQAVLDDPEAVEYLDYIDFHWQGVDEDDDTPPDWGPLLEASGYVRLEPWERPLDPERRN